MVKLYFLGLLRSTDQGDQVRSTARRRARGRFRLRTPAAFAMLLLGISGLASPSAALLQHFNSDQNNRPGSARAGAEFKVPFKALKLDNGLRVLLSEDHSAPVVAVAVYYDVGSRNEARGRTGFAHLFEHMMFQSSENVGKGEYFKYIEDNGGELNGSTHVDFTYYYEFLPSNRLELALWLESDRMRSLKITPENLQNQKRAVEEEIRLNIDNQAYWPALDKMDMNVYHNWAYAHSTFGSMKDLEAASVTDVKQFFDTYYVPNNAVLSIAGDFDLSESERLVRKYFASIPARQTPPPVDMSEPPGTPLARSVVYDAKAQVPEIIIAWKAPPRHSPDSYAVALLKSILSDGESCRLYQNLVKRNAISLLVQGTLDQQRGPGELYFQSTHKPAVSPRKVEAAIEAEIDRIKREGITSDELLTVKNQFRLSRFIGGDDEHRNLQTALGRAMDLAEFELFEGNPSLVNSELDLYMAVTPGEIQAAARRYLTPSNRSVLYIRLAAQGRRSSSTARRRK
jgi:zinc protease